MTSSEGGAGDAPARSLYSASVNLTADQCGVIAQLLPVFLLAIVIEQRALIARLHVGPWDRNTISGPFYVALGTVFLTHLSGVALAIRGTAGGLHGVWAIWLVAATTVSGIMLTVLTVVVTLVEQSRPPS